MRVEESYPQDRQIRYRKGTGIRNYDVRWIGRSYRYDSTQIPAKVEAAPTPSRAVIRSKDAIIRNATIRQSAKNYKRWDDKATPTRQSRTATPLAAVAKTVAIFVKKLRQQRVRRYHPAKPPPRPRDEKFVFVTNYPRPEQTPPDPTVGQQADCRGRAC